MPRRSIQLNGTITSLSMEDAFWEELDHQASKAGMEWQSFARQLIEQEQTIANRSAALKVSLLNRIRLEATKISSPNTRWLVTDNHHDYEFQTQQEHLSIGRDSECDITMLNREVSRKHATLVYTANTWWVMDLNSKNGTFLNGKPVEKSRLKRGDSIRLGQSTIIWMS